LCDFAVDWRLQKRTSKKAFGACFSGFDEAA